MYGLGIVPGVGSGEGLGEHLEEDLGAELGPNDFGPPAPTVIQQAGQVVTDITGISVHKILMYSGIALLGYYWYTSSDSE